MADDIRLTLACGDYDRTRPLWDGSVHPEGITLDCVVREPNEIFRRMLKDEEFDVSEMSLSNYIMECGKAPPVRGHPGFPLPRVPALEHLYS